MQTTTTTEERRLQRIEQLKARLQKEQARQTKTERKKRDLRFISLGILVDKYILPTLTPEKLSEWRAIATENLKPRNRDSVLEALNADPELGLPNAASLEAMEDAKNGVGPVYETVDECLDALDAQAKN